MPFQEINGKQIRNGSLEDKHIKGKLSESVLDIKWSDAGHAADILKNKTLIDYVQLGNVVSMPTGESSTVVNLSLDTSAVQIPGVMLNTPIRFRSNAGDPLMGAYGLEVIGKLTAKVGPGTYGGFDYKLDFFEGNGTTPYAFQIDVDVEIMYPIKTTLWDAAENFASNERFIDGVSDIRTKLDIQQLAVDIFGNGYALNSNGAQTLVTTLAQQLIDATHGTGANVNISASEIVDEVVSARGSFAELADKLNDLGSNLGEAVSDLIADLASAAASKGASLIGVEDAGNLFLASTVEAILTEIGLEIKAARGSMSSIDARLDVSIEEDGKLKDNAKIHKHDSFAFKATADSASIVFSALGSANLSANTIKENIDQLEVYINGSLQAETIHYNLTKVGGFITGVDFTPEVIVADDVIILKWSIYNE